jgi:hypothetical protein
MAKITLNSSEIPHVIDLVEQIMPGVKLSQYKPVLEGIQFTLDLKKPLEDKSLVELLVQVNGS